MGTKLQPPPEIYAAVVFLRRRGHAVTATEDPDRHCLDGEVVPTSWLMDMAVLEGFENSTAQES